MDSLLLLFIIITAVVPQMQVKGISRKSSLVTIFHETTYRSSDTWSVLLHEAVFISYIHKCMQATCRRATMLRVCCFTTTQGVEIQVYTLKYYFVSKTFNLG